MLRENANSMNCYQGLANYVRPRSKCDNLQILLLDQEIKLDRSFLQFGVISLAYPTSYN